MTAVLVRVVMGVSYDHNTTRTTKSMDSGRPTVTQLSPFVTKVEHNPEAELE
jgi:hypothetical protein